MGQTKKIRNTKQTPYWVKDYAVWFFWYVVPIILGIIVFAHFFGVKAYGGERNHKYDSKYDLNKEDNSSRTEIYDKNWNRKGYIEKGTAWDTIYNEKNERIGHIKNGEVYDKNWNRRLNIK